MAITQKEAQAALDVLCDYSNDFKKCDPAAFHAIQPVINMLITKYKAEWPYKDE